MAATLPSPKLMTLGGLGCKIKFETCPLCGTRLKMGIPRFGPGEVVCGNCKTRLGTGLTTWDHEGPTKRAIITAEELLAPSYIGTYSSLAGLTYLLANVVFVLMPLVAIIMIVATGLDAGAVAEGVLLLVVCGLYIRAYPLKHLRREIVASDDYSRKGATPMWYVRSNAREWLRVWWKYLVIPFIVICIIAAALTVVLLGGGV